jgi:hypothetical protein
MIKLYGTTDNYNTEYTERLHIDLAKDAYRATNRKDEYAQMTIWLERKEKILRHDKFIRWHSAGSPPSNVKNSVWRPPHVLQHRHLQMTKFPSAKGVSLTHIENKYGAVYFRDAFSCYVVGFKNPGFSAAQIEVGADNFYLPFQSLAAYHKIRFWNEDPLGRENAQDCLDVVHIKPGYSNKKRQQVSGRFDTVLINEGTGGHAGVTGKFTFEKMTCKLTVLLIPGFRVGKYDLCSLFQPVCWTLYSPPARHSLRNTLHTLNCSQNFPMLPIPIMACTQFHVPLNALQ